MVNEKTCETCKNFLTEKCHECEFENWEPKGGAKFDKGKLRWDLVPWEAFEKVVEVITKGAEKYTPHNWKGVEVERFKAALFRHYVDVEKGEEIDKEWGLLHYAHMTCNALFLLYLKMKELRMIK